MSRPSAVVVLTGSELVRGDKADANGAFLARELTRLGLEPRRILIVGDEPGELEEAVREGLEADACILSGGLGPTHDDRTVETLARLAGRQLVLDEDLERQIEDVARGVAERLGVPYAEFRAGVRKQASLPDGALSLGLAGTAPAVLLEHEDRVAVALPGPPSELRRLWPRVLEASPFRRVVERAEPPAHRVLRFFGPSESAVAVVLEDEGGEGDGLDVTVCAQDLEIRVDLFERPPGGGRGRAARVAGALAERFGRELFAEDERDVAEIVLERCRALGLRLATAESCTGGLVGVRLTGVPGASDVYAGGAVAYSNEAKERILGVPSDVLARHGAVSAEAAEAMARGALSAFGADVAVAVTGVAGPGGGTPEKPVGLVFVAVSSPGGTEAQRLLLSGDREAVRARATAISLHALRRLLSRSVTHARASDA
ncbi:MAG TPA: CinA family nicotinamide mononucleotide deamidase-related protein [Gaiellaceae bacterium]|nr:CinA family nicotinamide mononucleotide deamidase-related protein [Gaiellaceae bacterium]